MVAYLSSLEPTSSGTRGEALNSSDIPKVVLPVSFRPIVDRDEPFHRPVWFGPLPGHPGTSAVIEMQKGRVWLLDGDGRRHNIFVDVQNETIPGEIPA